MLTKASDIKGYSVLTQKNKRLDTVKDVVIDPNNKKVIALLVGKSQDKEDQVVSYKDIVNIANNQIVVKSENAVKPYTAIVENSKDKDKQLNSKTVLDSKGAKIGKLSDIKFDTETGEIKKLKVQINGETKSVDIKNIKAADDYIIVNKSKQKKASEKNDTETSSNLKKEAERVLEETKKSFKNTFS